MILFTLFFRMNEGRMQQVLGVIQGELFRWVSVQCRDVRQVQLFNYQRRLAFIAICLHLEDPLISVHIIYRLVWAVVFCAYNTRALLIFIWKLFNNLLTTSNPTIMTNYSENIIRRNERRMKFEKMLRPGNLLSKEEGKQHCCLLGVFRQVEYVFFCN